MPPKKRAKKNATPAKKKDAGTVVEVSNSIIPVNADIAPHLPVELWLEIVSYYPIVKAPNYVSHHGSSRGLSEDYLDRPKALRALSQTNRALRNLFLPVLWERLEVCAGKYEAWYKVFGELLEQKSIGLAANTELAAYVRIVTVVLSRYQTTTVLPAFSKCLSNLPNLHTIQVLHAHTGLTTPLKNAFQGYKFDSVHTLIIPDYTHEILRCCPNLRSVICTRMDGSKLISAIAKCAKQVEYLEGFWVDKAMMKRIVKNVPNLRVIRLAGRPDVETIGLMSTMKRLTTIELVVGRIKDDSEHSPEFKNSMKAAMDVLRKMPANDAGKWLRIRYDNEERYPGPVEGIEIK